MLFVRQLLLWMTFPLALSILLILLLLIMNLLNKLVCAFHDNPSFGVDWLYFIHFSKESFIVCFHGKKQKAHALRFYGHNIVEFTLHPVQSIDEAIFAISLSSPLVLGFPDELDRIRLYQQFQLHPEVFLC